MQAFPQTSGRLIHVKNHFLCWVWLQRSVAGGRTGRRGAGPALAPLLFFRRARPAKWWSPRLLSHRAMAHGAAAAAPPSARPRPSRSRHRTAPPLVAAREHRVAARVVSCVVPSRPVPSEPAFALLQLVMRLCRTDAGRSYPQPISNIMIFIA